MVEENVGSVVESAFGTNPDAIVASKVTELNSVRFAVRDRIHTERLGYSPGGYWAKHPEFNRAVSAAEPVRGETPIPEWIDACRAVREGVHKEVYGLTESDYRLALVEVNRAAGDATEEYNWIANRTLLNGN